MLVIRLARTGRAKYPTYRLVAADSTKAATGKFVEILGHYNPHSKELVVKRDETLRYLKNGARPSNTAIKLLQRDGVELPDWVKLKVKAPKPAPAAEEAPVAEEAAAEQNAEEAVETPAEDVAAEPEAVAAEAEERVATTATDEAAEAEAEVTDIDHTTTAADEAEQVEATEVAQDTADEAASE